MSSNNFEARIWDMTLLELPLPTMPNGKVVQTFVNDQVPHDSIQHQTLVLGMAGSGKSTLCLKSLLMRFKTNEIIAVVSYNSLAHKICHNWGIKAITIHRFLGLNASLEKCKAAYSLKGVKAIFYDEVFLWNYLTSVMIWEFMRANMSKPIDERIEVVAAGDDHQMEPINDPSCTPLLERLGNLVDHAMFHNVIVLRENHRLKTEFEKKWLALIEYQLFGPGPKLSNEEFVDTFFPSSQCLPNLAHVQKKSITRGLTHYVESAKFMNKFIESRIVRDTSVKSLTFGGETVYIGETLTCKWAQCAPFMGPVMDKKNKKKIMAWTPVTVQEEGKDGKVEHKKKGGLLVNNRYIVAGFSSKVTVILKDPSPDPQSGYIFYYNVPMEIATNIEQFWKGHFNSVCSSQGDEIDVPYVITDWQKQNPRWMYTAISRTKCMWNVHFLAMSLYSIDEKYKLFKAQQIVIGNKHQDKLAGRAHEGPDYVTPEWVVREYNKCDICPGQPGKPCRKTMSFEDHHQHKVTINRKHNYPGHLKANCELMCRSCNVALGDRG